MFVSDLLKEDTGHWNEVLIGEVFLPPDVDAILSMPRRRANSEDFWSWGWENTGVFTVKSACRELMRRREPQADIGNSQGKGDTWRALWRLKVQPKIRIFWWRVLKGFLPSFFELKRRHLMDRSVCPMYGHDEEDVFHVLTQCDHAKLFWNAALEFFDVKLPKLHPRTWSRDLLTISWLNKGTQLCWSRLCG